MVVAPSLPILLYLRSTLVTEVFFCQKSNKSTRLAGGLTGVKTHPKYEQAVAACGWPVVRIQRQQRS